MDKIVSSDYEMTNYINALVFPVKAGHLYQQQNMGYGFDGILQPDLF